MSAIVHSQMMHDLIRIFNALCTIETESVTQDPNSGEETISYAADPLMTSIRCYIEPTSPTTEVRRTDQTIVENAYNICLQGYYPHIDVEDRARLNDNSVHNILAVNSDDTHTVTFLTTEIINRAN